MWQEERRARIQAALRAQEEENKRLAVERKRKLEEEAKKASGLVGLGCSFGLASYWSCSFALLGSRVCSVVLWGLRSSACGTQSQ